ncbi:MAG: hypothetical protein JWM18_1138 [Chloroflexi bacterium]|jgi:hypothetical protein|nr:hypothetical protein [Chloroflexota bacterium]MDB5114341.1 hypothetical protein [Chloroflexota bacterium]
MSAWPLLLVICIGIAALRAGASLRRAHRGELVSLTLLGVVLGVGGVAILIVAPIVLGIALIALALAYDNTQQLGVGIVLLASGLLCEAVRDVWL